MSDIHDDKASSEHIDDKPTTTRQHVVPQEGALMPPPDELTSTEAVGWRVRPREPERARSRIADLGYRIHRRYAVLGLRAGPHVCVSLCNRDALTCADTGFWSSTARLIVSAPGLTPRRSPRRTAMMPR